LNESNISRVSDAARAGLGSPSGQGRGTEAEAELGDAGRKKVDTDTSRACAAAAAVAVAAAVRLAHSKRRCYQCLCCLKVHDRTKSSFHSFPDLVTGIISDFQITLV